MEEGIMGDPEPQAAAGKVLFHFLMSLDGFVAGPGHTMDFMDRTTVRDGLLQEYIDTTGAILAGRDGYDSAIGDSRPYGGAWEGPIFVLTHHPEDARPAEGSRSSTARSMRQSGSLWRPPKERTSRCSHPRLERSFCTWA
jgi:hypothetical protein